jgi:hypothetical protein
MKRLSSLLSVLLAGLAVLRPAGAADMERFRVFTNGDGGYHTIRIPAMVVTSKGTVLAFAEGRKHSPRDDGENDLIVRRSGDGGETWSDIQVVRAAEGEESTMGNPTPIVDRETGDIVLLFCRDNETAYRTISDDDGRTWSEPVEITDAFQTFEYDVKRVATGPVHGIQLKSGRLVAPIWVSNLELEAKQKLSRKYKGDPEGLLREGHDVFRSGVIVSDDHGRTWKAGGLVPGTIAWLNEATVYQAENGDLILNCRAHLSGYRARAVSKDGGMSWSEPVLREDLVDPTCQGAALKLRHGSMAGAVVLSNLHKGREPGNRVVGFTLDRRNLGVRLSPDDGETWPHARVIDPKPAGYSDLAQLPDGRVLCLFENGDEVYRERVDLVRFDPARIIRKSGAANDK